MCRLTYHYGFGLRNTSQRPFYLFVSNSPARHSRLIGKATLSGHMALVHG